MISSKLRVAMLARSAAVSSVVLAWSETYLTRTSRCKQRFEHLNDNVANSNAPTTSMLARYRRAVWQLSWLEMSTLTRPRMNAIQQNM